MHIFTITYGILYTCYVSGVHVSVCVCVFPIKDLRKIKFLLSLIVAVLAVTWKYITF